MTLSKSLPAAAALLLLLPACAVCMSLPLTRIRGQNCCSSDQWESGMGYVFGGAQPYSTGYGTVSYDYTSQFLATNQTFISTEGKVFSQRGLIVGKTRKMYIIDGATGRCTISNMPTGVPKQCVPPFLKRVSTISLGELSAGHVNSQVFQGAVPGANITLLMSQEHCMPMSQTVLQAGNTLSIQSFFNLTSGIKDPSVFKIPSACKGDAVEHDNSVAQLLLRSVRSAAVPGLCEPTKNPCLLFH